MHTRKIYARERKERKERKDDPQCYEHSFPSNEARANPRMDDDICWLSCCCLFSSFSRGFYLRPLRCFSLFSSKTKISKFLFYLIRSRTVEVGRTNNDYYYIVLLNHYLFHYLFSKKNLEVNSRTSTRNSLFMKAKLKFRN